MALFLTLGRLLPGLVGKEITDRVARVSGIILTALLVILLLSLGKCAYDKSVVSGHETKREAAAASAREDAADRRVEDQTINTKSEEELHNVVNAAPGGTLSPAAKSLACERLRRQGRVPPACGPQGGN